VTLAARATGALALLLVIRASVASAAQGDFIMPRKGQSQGSEMFPPATFPHTLHRVLFKCYVCHDSLFKMKLGADTITMDAINQGKSCGACHDGKNSFEAVGFGNCERCHQK
jgi:c(7)-type cytochrome triheme protein